MKKLSILLGVLAGIAVALQAPSNGAAEAVAMSMVGAPCLFCTDNTCEDGYHEAWNSEYPQLHSEWWAPSEPTVLRGHLRYDARTRVLPGRSRWKKVRHC